MIVYKRGDTFVQYRIGYIEYENRYGKHPNVEVIVSGNIEAMVCKYNILNKYDKKYGRLVDRFGNKYYVKYKDNLMYIYDYNRRKMTESFIDSGVNYIRINREEIGWHSNLVVL